MRCMYGCQGRQLRCGGAKSTGSAEDRIVRGWKSSDGGEIEKRELLPKARGLRRIGKFVLCSANSRSYALQGVVEDCLGVEELFLGGRDVQDKGLKAAADVPGDFVGDFFVAAHQVGTERLVVLEWPHPIHALYLAHIFDHFRELLLPDRKSV